MDGLDEAIKILEDTNKLLFLTGAGMSADSGIPTFRDEGGFWNNFPVYKDKKLKPIELANGTNFLFYPEMCWGFYEWRRRNADKNKPHKGYDVINFLLQQYDAFIITTNTDGYHLRSGAPKDKIQEVHGSMWRLQHLERDKFVIESYEVPLCDLNEETMLVDPESMPKYKGRILRPNTFMWGDVYYVEDKNQYNKKKNFIKENIDTVVLIGSDIGIPTNVREAKILQEKGSKIICINPNPNSNGKLLKPDVHLVEKAEKALLEIYQALMPKFLDSLFEFPKDEFVSNDYKDPKEFHSYDDLLAFAVECDEKNDLGAAFYYVSLVLNYKDIDDVIKPNGHKDLTHLQKEACVIASLLLGRMDMHFREEFKKKGKEVIESREMELLKEFSSHYKTYSKLKERFGTEFN